MNNQKNCNHCKRTFKNQATLNAHLWKCPEYKDYLEKITNTVCDLYNNQNYSRRELSKTFKLHINKITDILKKNNINIRTQSESQNTPRKKMKMKKTFQEKYGCDNPYQSEEIKEKIRQTNLEKYGNESYSRTEECKEKVKQTSLKKYGVNNAYQSEEIKEKIRQTNLEKIGYSYPMQSEEVKKKSKESLFEKYGDKNYNNIEKIKQTCLERYGVDNFRKSIEMKNMIWSEEAKQKSLITKINNGNATDWSKYDKNDWNYYRFHVWKLTEVNYKNNIEIINPNLHQRSKNGFHLDHIVPIIIGFEMGIDIDIIASIKNLQILTAKDNITKNRFCEEELIKKLMEDSDEN